VSLSVRPATVADIPALEREEDATVVGFAVACTHDRGEALVRAFYTHPSVWGRGAGRALMGEVLRGLRARGFGVARLWTAEENHRPRRFYEQAGWRLDGTERHQAWQGSEFVEVGYRIELTSLDRA
jgi:GNAT superfamily N-acetyltransferase